MTFLVVVVKIHHRRDEWLVVCNSVVKSLSDLHQASEGETFEKQTPSKKNQGFRESQEE